jgi:solute carrier family 39 (zinc transporter), member 11
MLAASYFSLLAPAVEMAAGSPTYGETWAFIPATVGFLMGAAFVYAGDKYGPVDALSSYMALDDSGMRKKMDLSGAAAEENELHTPGKHGPRDFDKEWQLRRRKPDLESDYDDSFHKRVVSKAERRLQLHRVFLLVFAVTIHNFPEGLAVGVGFGGVGSSPKATLQSAWALAIGIGLQNFPEGFAGYAARLCVVLPLVAVLVPSCVVLLLIVSRSICSAASCGHVQTPFLLLRSTERDG